MLVHLMVASVMCLTVIIKYGKSTSVVVVVKCVFFLTALLKGRKKQTKLEGEGKKGKSATTAGVIRRLDLYNSSA